MISQKEYNEHHALLQEQINNMNNKEKHNSKVYEAEWEWCASACAKQPGLDQSFHDFLVEHCYDTMRFDKAYMIKLSEVFGKPIDNKLLLAIAKTKVLADDYGYTEPKDDAILKSFI